MDNHVPPENNEYQEPIASSIQNKKSAIWELRCEEYGFTYQTGENVIFIMTGVGAWCLEFKYNNIELYHRNPKYPMKKYRHGTLREDYHAQNVQCKTVEAYLEYIYCHDKKYFGLANRKK